MLGDDMGRAELRDQGLRRVSTLTRWIAAGAVAGAGVLSLATARLLPGTTKQARTAVTTNPPPADPAPADPTLTAPATPDPATAQNTDPALTDPALSPPVAPPRRTRLPSRIVSGAS